MFKEQRIEEFFQALSAKEPAPGGGAASASVALHGVSLGMMVIRFTMGTTKDEALEAELDEKLRMLEDIKQELLTMVDVDNISFTPVLEAMALPKSTDDEKQHRKERMNQALAMACDSPRAIMLASKMGLDILTRVAEIGNRFLLSDALAGIRFLQTAIETASYNISVNAKMITDHGLAREYFEFVDEIVTESDAAANAALEKGKL